MLKQSVRAATPFLISKQPYFPPLPPVLLRRSFLPLRLACVSNEPLVLTSSRAPPIYHPGLFLSTQRSRHRLPFASLSSRARSFRERSPFLARFFAARSSARTRVAPISLPRHFRPPFPSFPLHDLLFSFSSPSPLSYYFSSLIGSFALLTSVICRGRCIGRLV